MVARRLEGKQKPREHRLGTMTHVETILELPEVLGQMFGRDMNVSAFDAVLEPRPEALSGVDVGIAAYPFVGRMVDRPVVVAQSRDLGVGREFVRADCRAALDVGQYMPLQGLALHVRNNSRHHIAAAFNHS